MKMKKLFSSLLVTVFAVAMMASGAWASEIDIDGEAAPFRYNNPDYAGTSTGAVTVDRLWVQSGVLDNVDLGDSANWPNPGVAAGNRAIGYYSTVALKTDSTLKFQFSGCAVKADNTLYLLAYDNSNGKWVTVASLNDYGTDGNGNYTWLRMQIGTIDGGVIFADKDGNNCTASTENELPAGAVVVISKDDAGDGTGYDGLQIVVNQNATTGTVAVTDAKDNNSNPLTAPLAGPETIIDVIHGVSAQIWNCNGGGLGQGAATSTIDVNADPSRAKFVDEDTEDGGCFMGSEVGEADTVSTASEAAVLVTNTAEYGLTLNDGDTYTLTIKRDDVTGVTGVDVGGDSATEGTNEWTYTNNFGDLNLTADPGTAITINVDGNTALYTGTWKVDLSIDPDQDSHEPKDLGEINLLTDADSHIWGINGLQAQIPYLVLNAPGYESFIKVSNDSNMAGDFIVDATIWNFTDNITTTQSGVVVKNIPAHSCSTVSEANLMTALGLDASKIYHINMLVTVIVPTNQAHIAAFQKDPRGRTMVPVLYDNASTRRWFE